MSKGHWPGPASTTWEEIAHSGNPTLDEFLGMHFTLSQLPMSEFEVG
jgi:hypothetical protein